MKFTLSMLKQHLDTISSIETICDTLNAIGLEVESVENKADQLKDFKVAEIVEATQHPNADRLRVCKVNMGTEIIQVVCGAANARAGLKTVLGIPGMVVPANGMVLKLSEIRGVASQGMLCSAQELGLSQGNETISEGIIELPANFIVGEPFAPQFGQKDTLNDPLIDIAITPNRPDCFGIHGIARDLAAAGLGNLIAPKLTPVKGKGKSSITPKFGILNTQHISSVGTSECEAPSEVNGWSIAVPTHEVKSVYNENLCPVFAGRVITGVKNIPSPQWLQDQLKSVGLRPISALVDITNFMTINSNRPLHVFDVDKLTGDTLTIRAAKTGESLEALDGKTYALTPQMCVIADESGAISLSGIMGGLSTGCSESTVNVFLESALWNPFNIAKTGRALGIHSDARQRFERGVDPKFTIAGLEMATQMILDICGGTASDVIKIGNYLEDERLIKFPISEVKRLTGVEIPAFEMKLTLESLGFFVGRSSPDDWQIVPPTWRPDITNKSCIVEEIIRILGLNRVIATPFPRLPHIHKPILTLAQSRTRSARRALCMLGFNEAVSWSFISEAEAKIFGGNTAHLTLENPISSELSVMRPSSLPGILAALKLNQSRGMNNLHFIEIGAVFRGRRPEDQLNYATAVRVGLIAERKDWQNTQIADVNTIKQDLFAALEAVGFSGEQAQISTDNLPDYFHPSRSGALKLGKTILGYFGELHPSLAQHYDISGRPVAFELNLDAIPAPKKKPTRTKGKLELSPLQAITRDFAFIVEPTTKAGDIVRVVKKVDPKHIANVSIFDVYEGKGLEGKKSIAIEVTLQPIDKSFLEAEIEAISETIINAASGVGAVLRR